MKILHVIPGLSNASGPTQVVYHLAQQAVAQGHEVTVCYIQGRGTDPVYDFDERVELRGFPAVGWRKWGYSPALRRYLQQEIGGFDIVHVHSLWLYPNIAVMQAATKHKVPYIIRPAGSLEPWALGFAAWKKRLYLALIEKRIINQSAAIHAVSEQEAENIRKLRFRPRLIMMPNGIDVQSFRATGDKNEARRKLNLPENQIILLFLGRIHPVKNLEFLIRVMQQLVRQQQNVLLVIAGPDQHAYAQQIKTEIQHADIGAYCRFLGEVEGTTKADVYAAGDIFVLPSFSENFAVAVTEALAAGLPVVVSQHTPWAEVEEKNCGFWLPLKENSFLDAINMLIKDNNLRVEMSHNGVLHAAGYDWKAISKRVIDSYQEIVGQ